MGLLAGRSIIVTGAGRGIGAEVAVLCAREGAQVVVNDVGAAIDGSGVDAGPAAQTVSRIRDAGGSAVPSVADVGEPDQVEDLVRTAILAFGHLDVVINVAGNVRDADLVDLEPADWDAVIRVHLRGAYNTARAAARFWRTARRGNYRLINTTSGAGFFGAPGKANYAAAKMGIIGFTYACANALLPYGVTVNAISPGGDTRLNSWKVRAPVPVANAAPAYAYVASTRSGWLTGQVIGSRDRSIRLLAKPRFIREIVSTAPAWNLEDVAERIEASFRPAVEESCNPYEAEARRLIADIEPKPGDPAA